MCSDCAFACIFFHQPAIYKLQEEIEQKVSLRYLLMVCIIYCFIIWIQLKVIKYFLITTLPTTNNRLPRKKYTPLRSIVDTICLADHWFNYTKVFQYICILHSDCKKQVVLLLHCIYFFLSLSLSSHSSCLQDNTVPYKLLPVWNDNKEILTTTH